MTGLAALDPETNTYVNFGRRRREGKLDVYSAFAQDSWRLTPTLTLNAGVRWDVQMPFSPSNDTMTTASLADICGVSGLGDGGIYNACNFYAPGSSGGKSPEFTQFTTGTRGYNTDWNNIAPNVGVAWRPERRDADGCGGCSAIPSRRRFAAAIRRHSNGRASAASPASTDRTRAAR